ncbi:MAG: low molecular weight protein-tyrosine-phosphatase [Porticoccaceae bacterium]
MTARVEVLFVCLGNICRSPTAHGVFEALLVAEGLTERIAVDSAGTGDWHLGRPPDLRTRRAALARGYDLEHLRARQVEAADFQRFDYILAMDNANLADLRRLRPGDFRGTLDLFLNFGSGVPVIEVPDPYHGSADSFEQVLDLVENAARGLLAHIRANSPRF